MMYRRGLSLVEVLVALAVIGLVFVSLATLQILSLQITSDARSDTDLLQDAVRAYERQRVIVVDDFEDYHRGCAQITVNGTSFVRPEGDGLCQGPVAGVAGARFSIFGPNFDLDDLEEGKVANFANDVWEGIVRLRVDVDRDGRTLAFEQVVSCVDAAERPSLTLDCACRLVPPPECTP